MPDKLDPQDLFNTMVAAVRTSIGQDVPAARKYIESSARALAANTKEVADWLATGEITVDEAQALMRMHERSAKMALTAAETIGLAMAERAINAAIDAVAAAVNKALGLALL
jgi:hypothetical protein